MWIFPAMHTLSMRVKSHKLVQTLHAAVEACSSYALLKRLKTMHCAERTVLDQVPSTDTLLLSIYGEN